MARIIMQIPDQEFCFMKNFDVREDLDKIQIELSEAHHGTILLVTDAVEGDEDALVYFGVPDGDTNGRIAFWLRSEGFDAAWNKMISAKKECLSEEY